VDSEVVVAAVAAVDSEVVVAAVAAVAGVVVAVEEGGSEL